MKKIQILGTGCAKCMKLTANAEEAAKEAGVAYEIEKVTDIKKIMDFGAFVEIFPGTDGLVHISQISDQRVKSVSDVLKEGEEVMVKVLEVDKQGRIKLSRREALREAQESSPATSDASVDASS